MSTAANSELTHDRAALIRQAFRLEYITLAWMTIEAAVAISSGVAADSLTLIAFALFAPGRVLSAREARDTTRGIVWLHRFRPSNVTSYCAPLLPCCCSSASEKASRWACIYPSQGLSSDCYCCSAFC